jgi:glycosyltransferase involved in cell wall biosynthesis
MSPTVSVVTPFHNAAPYLRQCIESVLSQDLDEFEYVLVNNASTDGGDAIAQHYARCDPRIRVASTERLLPQIENYNRALRLVSPASRYCKMVQADDWLYPTCLSRMVDLSDQHPSIGVVSAYELQHDHVIGSHLEAGVEFVDGRTAARMYLLEDAHMFGSPSTVMYRADLVRSRPDFFDLGRLHEDTEVIFELLRRSDFGFVHQVLSFSRRQEGSISDQIKDYLTQKLDQLVVVSRFGPHFLDADELTMCWQQKRRSYYRALARRWLRDLSRRDEDFWQYQQQALALIDERIEPKRIALELVPGLAERMIRRGSVQ